jgi:hypothetical protein
LPSIWLITFNISMPFFSFTSITYRLLIPFFLLYQKFSLFFRFFCKYFMFALNEMKNFLSVLRLLTNCQFGVDGWESWRASKTK